MRTAGLMPPSTDTWPTPGTELSRCVISVSARSLRLRIEMVFEVSASVMIGASAGFTFE